MSTSESYQESDQAIAKMSMPNLLLRLEGAAVFIAAIIVYYSSGYTWWLFPLLLLAPDLSALGYLAGPRVGSLFYNAAHVIIGPLVLGLMGWWLGWELGIQLALIWFAHIGMDRAFGYDLKYPDAFKHTHMDAI